MLKEFLKAALLFAIITIGFSSCQKDTETVRSPLHYNWHLIKYSAGLAGLENYNMGDVRWEFNANNTLDVQINTTLPSNSNMPIKTTSTVSYTENGAKVTIGNTTYDYVFENSGKKLVISDSPEVDGPMIVLERN